MPPPEMSPEEGSNVEDEGQDENMTEAAPENPTDAPAAEVEAVRAERQRERKTRFGKRLRPPTNPVGTPPPTDIPELESVEIPDAIWDLRQ